MMYSDYYAISSCAFSVVFIPFLIMAAMQFALSLQAFNYENRKYMKWLGCTFAATCLPLIFICAIAVVAQMALRVYLTHTYFEELRIIVVYAAWLLLASIVLLMGFARYVRTLERAMWNVPRINDRRLKILLITSSLIWGFFTLILNLYGWRLYVYVMPLGAPFVPPLVNLFLRRYPRRMPTYVSEDA